MHDKLLISEYRREVVICPSFVTYERKLKSLLTFSAIAKMLHKVGIDYVSRLPFLSVRLQSSFLQHHLFHLSIEEISLKQNILRKEKDKDIREFNFFLNF